MTSHRCRSASPRPLQLLLVPVLLFALAACSGGGGDDDGGVPLNGTNTLVSITLEGEPTPLWQAPGGPPPAGVIAARNARLFLTFGGNVDPSSLPSGGRIDGAIDISLFDPGIFGNSLYIPVDGSLTIEDDPAVPGPNGRRVVFDPGEPLANSGLGYLPGRTYRVQVGDGTNGFPPPVVAGEPLAQGGMTAFVVCAPTPGQPGACYVDRIPGAAFITETFPPTDVNAPPGISPGDLTPGGTLNPFSELPNTFTAFVSEPLLPTGLDASNFRLVLEPGGEPVLGTVRYFPAGSPEARPDEARLDFTASLPLRCGATYRLEIGPGLMDLGGNPVQAHESDPVPARRLQTLPGVLSMAPDLVEDFSSTERLAAGTDNGVIVWEGTGAAEGRAATNLYGNGAAGPLVFPPGNHSLDTGQSSIVIGGEVAFERGIWNTTFVNVMAGATVRITGPFPAHLRARGGITVDGSLIARGGNDPSRPPGDPEQGPRQGQVNNGFPNFPPIVLGGAGGPGGGRGGNASASPDDRNMLGDAGFGATRDDGSPNLADDLESEVTYGGGKGGRSGFFPPQVPGETGGLGGAGGSAWRRGDPGQPEDPTQACAPLENPLPIAQSVPPPLSFMPPLSEGIGIRGGSGGGGGGDHLETGPSTTPFGTPITPDDQGGGGGGGGGGLRLSCAGNLTIGPLGLIDCRGISGGLPAIFAGAGGAGSGGQIWCQSLSGLTVAGSTLLVAGGDETFPCSRQLGGAGGAGLYQLEDADGVLSTNFNGGAAEAGQNVFTAALLDGQQRLSGEVVSDFFDAAVSDPQYLQATGEASPAVSLGNVAGATLEIRYQGAAESAATPGTPDLATLTSELPADQIAQLDGLRYVRFVIRIRYPALPILDDNDVLPSVDEIRITLEAETDC